MTISERIEVPHPSEFITEELEARGWSRDDLCTAMCGGTHDPDNWGITRLALDMYLEIGWMEPDMRMGDCATQMAHAFGVHPDFFVNLERAWLATVKP